jgi:hypothetical protein
MGGGREKSLSSSIGSKRVLIRKKGSFLTACVEGILRLFTIFYLHRKFSKFKEICTNRKFEFYEKHILASELFLSNKETE